MHAPATQIRTQIDRERDGSRGKYALKEAEQRNERRNEARHGIFISLPPVFVKIQTHGISSRKRTTSQSRACHGSLEFLDVFTAWWNDHLSRHSFQLSEFDKQNL